MFRTASGRRKRRNKKWVISGYYNSVRQRPTIYLWLAFFLTLLVGGAPALPAAGEWQCRYASQVVAAAAAVPGAMPCHSMPISGRGQMACCAARPSVMERGPHLAAPDCHPTFTPLIAVSATLTEQGRVAQPPLAVSGTPSGGAASFAPTLLALPLRQRPPPGAHLLHTCFASSHRLRGPPSA